MGAKMVKFVRDLKKPGLSYMKKSLLELIGKYFKGELLYFNHQEC